jgi:3-isopropylmalate/(R)-2-methylmalate dehydratase large subunit
MNPASQSKTPRTLFDKVWDEHVVVEEAGKPAVLYIDMHLVHEVTSPQAFSGLRARGLRLRRPDRTVATMDHSTPTLPRSLARIDPQAEAQLETLKKNCAEFGVELFELGNKKQGIVHVIGPELGLTLPGSTVVCGDSHTATHGAFGALAFGIGTSEVEHVLATQCLLQRRPKRMVIDVAGRFRPGVSAKDLILAIIARIGVGGGVGHVLEYRGDALRGLDMEGRMTVCNMSIEAGARAGMIAPDDVTFQYLAGRERAPQGAAFEVAMAKWRQLRTDDGATFDTHVSFDAADLEPMVTFGTNPAMGIPISGAVPNLDAAPDAKAREALKKALTYMDLEPGKPLAGHKVDVVFLGSCTNSRITDLRDAAAILRGRHVKSGVRMLVVPGSHSIKKQAEAEGLHEVFLSAGAEWREPGCSMCIAMNGDELSAGQYAVSTSNRNFEGRQGKGSRTFLASPLTAAASAVTGRVEDPRPWLARSGDAA